MPCSCPKAEATQTKTIATSRNLLSAKWHGIWCELPCDTRFVIFRTVPVPYILFTLHKIRRPVKAVRSVPFSFACQRHAATRPVVCHPLSLHLCTSFFPICWRDSTQYERKIGRGYKNRANHKIHWHKWAMVIFANCFSVQWPCIVYSDLPDHPGCYADPGTSIACEKNRLILTVLAGGAKSSYHICSCCFIKYVFSRALSEPSKRAHEWRAKRVSCLPHIRWDKVRAIIIKSCRIAQTLIHSTFVTSNCVVCQAISRKHQQMNSTSCTKKCHFSSVELFSVGPSRASSSSFGCRALCHREMSTFCFLFHSQWKLIHRWPYKCG